MKNCLCPNTLKTLGPDFRNFYRKQTKDNIEKRLDHHENERIIRLFFKKMGDYMVEYRAGVYINRLGYFFVYKHPFKFYRTPHFKHLSPYMFTFIPTENSIMKYWSMDFRFNRNLVSRLKENVKDGYRYLNLINGVSKKDMMYIGAAPNSIKYKKIKDAI